MYSMSYFTQEIAFVALNGAVGLTYFIESGEWEVTSTSITTGADAVIGFGFFRISFNLRRRPGFFLISVGMTLMLLSFVNLMVFLIPVESGEKISYCITVLLALAVFLSVIGDMLPRSSDIMPLMTIYLMILFIISVLAVIVAVGIVWLHHREEKDTRRQNATASFKNIFGKVRSMNRATASLTKVMPSQQDPESPDNDHSPPSASMEGLKKLRAAEKSRESAPPGEGKSDKNRPTVNKYKIIGQHIDMISFVVFMVVWCLVTFCILLMAMT
ncbi:neuronal acetylcholine receptor subunit non-alpha-2-like [Aplysia californica]|uniref:Neuronal acetylcholine receptor subunit non-alpha-2-like n=1 Tax=Aplysia californica TaxID=6500 RepID=A0ABM1W2D9_APLCA|nr:neuronal acetylcholine receptor subunit non-alpha-2-like [Aplysia californica]